MPVIAAFLFVTSVASADPLVDVPTLIPDAVLDLRYATENNFLKRKVYPSARCLLRESVAKQLARAGAELRKKRFRLRLFDCYRPRSVQWEMWKILPQPGYVADPRQGSNHNRGAAVDLSLVTSEGKDVEMPTEFDSFDKRAHAGATEGVSPAAQANRELLRSSMESAGFKVNPMEWWHFDAPNPKRFPVLDQSL